MDKNNYIYFEIPGDPIALKRHRHTKSGFSYDPSKNDKADFLAKCMNNKPSKPFTKAVALELEFIFTRPKSHFGTGRNSGVLKPSAPEFHTKRPDLDNLIKFVEDALNGVFYTDDRQIMYVGATKTYGEYSCVRIGIWETEK